MRNAGNGGEIRVSDPGRRSSFRTNAYARPTLGTGEKNQGSAGALRGAKHGGANEAAMEIIERYKNADK